MIPPFDIKSWPSIRVIPFFHMEIRPFFVRKDVFFEMKGFDTEAVFEDVDFFGRLRRRGKVVILKFSVTTSARRFRQTGFYRQKAKNVILSFLNGLGFKPHKLVKRWYPDIR